MTRATPLASLAKAFRSACKAASSECSSRCRPHCSRILADKLNRAGNRYKDVGELLDLEREEG